MSRVIDFKSHKNLMAIRTSNSFGDQIIALIDISKPTILEHKDSDFPYISGQIVAKHRSYEGDWEAFTEKNLIKLFKLNSN